MRSEFVEKDVRVLHFEDGSDMVRCWEDMPPERRDQNKSARFCGGTIEDAKQHLQYGYIEAVDRVRDLWEQLDSVPTPRTTWAPAVTGAQVVVPQAIAGAPTCMRRKVQTRSKYSPITIFVNQSVSQSVKPKIIEKRGLAVVALANKLAAYRPVQLVGVQTHAYNARGMFGLDGVGALIFEIPIGHAPINISKACGLLASAPAYRALGFDLTYGYSKLAVGNIPWAWNAGNDKKLMERKLRETLGWKPDDVYLHGAHSNDPAASDPKKWVESMIELHKGALA